MNNSYVNLASITTYRFGGICKNFIEITTEDDLSKLPKNLNSENTFFLGKGSNVAFSDDEFQNYIIKSNLTYIKKNQSNGEIEIGSGYFLPDLSRYLKKHSLSGGEFLLGIPGSVGGGIKMNAGAWGFEFSSYLKKIKFYDLESKEIKEVDKNNFLFGYRQSKNLDKKIIISGTFFFEPGDPIKIGQKMTELNNLRKKSQPPALYNAGSVFKNSENYFAGELIENAGLKGYSVGNVSVSKKHANFFIAKKGAKSQSLYDLVNYVKSEVFNKFGVQLEEEILFVGNFKD